MRFTQDSSFHSLLPFYVNIQLFVHSFKIGNALPSLHFPLKFHFIANVRRNKTNIIKYKIKNPSAWNLYYWFFVLIRFIWCAALYGAVNIENMTVQESQWYKADENDTTLNSNKNNNNNNNNRRMQVLRVYTMYMHNNTWTLVQTICLFDSIGLLVLSWLCCLSLQSHRKYDALKSIGWIKVNQW